MREKTKSTHSGATGPRTAEGKKIASQNSVKHGLFSKSLQFRNAIEEAEYKKFLEDLFDSIQPKDRMEAILVEDVAVCSWRERLALACAEREMRNRPDRSVEKTIRHFFGRSDVLKMPLPGIDASSAAGSAEKGGHSAGWECREMVLRLSNGEQEQSGTAGIVGADKETIAGSSSEQYAIQLRMADPLDTILRYETKLRRDRYRSIDYLLRIRELNRQ